MNPRTMYRKIWDAHVVHEAPGEPSLIYIDRHLVHEGTSPQAFAGLKEAGRKVRRPDLAFAVMDHSVPTKNRNLPILDEAAMRPVLDKFRTYGKQDATDSGLSFGGSVRDAAAKGGRT